MAGVEQPPRTEAQLQARLIREILRAHPAAWIWQYGAMPLKGRPNRTYPWLVEAVASRSRSEGCWEDWPWLGDKNGYPVATKPGSRQVAASHLVLELDGRLRPGPDHAALHSCDNPQCLNPGHLRWGTRQENMDDMVERRRGRTRPRRGETSPASKLTEELVREARRRVATGELRQELAREFGVHKTTLGDAVRGKTWAHVR